MKKIDWIKTEKKIKKYKKKYWSSWFNHYGNEKSITLKKEKKEDIIKKIKENNQTKKQ